MLALTKEDIDYIKEYTSTENRSKSKGTAPYLYNLIYDVETRSSTESHIKSHKFLGKYTNVHKFIHDKLNLVQADIYAVAKTDSEVISLCTMPSSFAMALSDEFMLTNSNT